MEEGEGKEESLVVADSDSPPVGSPADTNVSGKPKNPLDVNRDNGSSASKGDANKGGRTTTTVHRLKMYSTRPKRDSKGTILRHDLQSKDLPSTRIQPDRRWFGNTRVVGQKELEFFRDELETRLSNNYNVILKGTKFPMSLLTDHQKQARVHLLDTEPFADAFGPKRKRKRPKVVVSDYEALAKKADGSQDAFEEKYPSSAMEASEDGFRDLVRHNVFEKGQSERIWGELYKVIDSSDVIHIRKDTKKGVYVDNLTEVEVSSSRDVLQQLVQETVDDGPHMRDLQHVISYESFELYRIDCICWRFRD